VNIIIGCLLHALIFSLFFFSEKILVNYYTQHSHQRRVDAVMFQPMIEVIIIYDDHIANALSSATPTTIVTENVYKDTFRKLSLKLYALA